MGECMMNYEQALAYINDKDKYGSRLGLASVGMLLDNLGNPHKGLKYLHVGGTNGKGSTSAYLASIISEGGYKVGLYTSPYLEKFTERIQINGLDIPEEDLGRITEMVKSAADKMVTEGIEHPTTFEIVTAIAFVYYNEQNVDYVVLEVGLGGRFDSTNIIDESLASIITTIDYDHVDVLGDTIGEIAYQKAGIIKKGGLVISYPQLEEAEKVLITVSNELGADFIKVNVDNLTISEQTYKGSVFSFKYGDTTLDDLSICMLGEYQIYNAATAITTILELRERKKIDISDSHIYSGLKKTKWKGRLEVLRENPIFLIDGAHNLQGITHLAKAIKLFSYNRLIIGMGVLKDKDYTHMIETLVPLADSVVVTEVNMPRKLKAEILAKEVSRICDDVIIEQDVGKAVKKAYEMAEEGDMILFGGSLYLIGEVRTKANLLFS